MNPKITSLLVVDDDPVFTRFVCQLVQSLAAELPCQVTCADSAEAAEAELRQHPFDLALVDFHLPRASGLDLLSKIASLLLASIAVVMVRKGVVTLIAQVQAGQ